MDFIPELGEPGIIDELFWLTPLLLQLILLVVIFNFVKSKYHAEKKLYKIWIFVIYSSLITIIFSISYVILLGVCFRFFLT